MPLMDAHARGTVLVVDDEPTIGEIVARYLSRAGYAPRVAHDGPAAVAEIARERPDLVVLDLMLPGIDVSRSCADCARPTRDDSQ